jgi:hypothetical protein
MVESDDEFPFDTVDPNTPICKNINPIFCKSLFNLKQRIYNDIIYSKDPNTSEAQDIKLVNDYEAIIHQLHLFFGNVLKGVAVHPPILSGISAATQLAFETLYTQCLEERQNNDRYTLDLYKMLMDSMFHTYIYDMGSQ